MKFSNFFIPTLKNVSSDVKMKSHELMIRSGMIRMETSGIYSWLPLGFRILKKIIKITEHYHDRNQINQILMPTIQNSEIWKISNRYDSYGKEMLKITDSYIIKNYFMDPRMKKWLQLLVNNISKAIKAYLESFITFKVNLEMK